jgi:hypothetical protein
MRCCIVLAAWAATSAAGASAQAATVAGATLGRQLAPIRVTPENVRFNNYLRDLAGPTTVIKVVGGGLVNQLWRQPADGDNDSESLAKAMASRAAQTAVQETVRHGLAAVMHHSTDYQPCECKGFGPKVEHALLETFTDRRADGTRAISIPRLAGAYAGNFGRLAWDHDRNAADAALGATVSIGFSALFNIARELTGVGR